MVEEQTENLQGVNRVLVRFHESLKIKKMVNLVSLVAFPFYTSSEGFGLTYRFLGLSAKWQSLQLKPTMESCRMTVQVRPDPLFQFSQAWDKELRETILHKKVRYSQ